MALARVTALACYAAAFATITAMMGFPVPGEATPMAELAKELAAQREKVHPGKIARTLRYEMERDVASPLFAWAVRASSLD
jgi:hypothetical protein